MSDKIDLTTVIAEAIKEADKSWFNEDYSKQALNVVRALRREGIEPVPMEPPEEMIEEAVDDMPMGRLKREDLMREIYKAMLRRARGYVV